MLEDRLVAVLGARAADQDQGRERSGSLGLGQCPGQRHPPGLVRVADLDHLVRKRSLGRLRPAQLGGLVGLLQGQRQADCPPGSRFRPPRSPRRSACPHTYPASPSSRRTESVLSRVIVSTFSPSGSLVGAVHLGCQLALGRLADVHDDAQAQARPDAQFSFPDLLRSRRIAAWAFVSWPSFADRPPAGAGQRNRPASSYHRHRTVASRRQFIIVLRWSLVGPRTQSTPLSRPEGRWYR